LSISLVFKNWEDSFHMGELHENLRPILTFLINLAWTRYGRRLEVTSNLRKDGGIHSYFRAIDLVPEDRDVEIMEKLREAVNQEWDYGKPGLQVIPAVRHGTGPHLHVQCRSESHRREHDE